MSYPEIRFGTDGWRAVLGQDFTTDRFAAVVDGLLNTDLMADAKAASKPILVAHDTRFLGRAYSRLAAEQLRAAGHTAVLCDGPTATPGIGAAIVDRGAALGLMVTASHNPPQYLGLKLKGSYGGSATTDFIAAVEGELAKVPRRDPAKPVAYPTADPAGVEVADMNAVHLARIAEYMDLTPGRDSMVHDAMYGSGIGLLERALGGTGACTVPVRQELNPGFGGIGPEPVADRLDPMFAATRDSDALLGIATDGDADRVAACDAEGRFVFPHEIYALMLVFLVDELGKRGRVVRNLATSELVRKVAEDRGLDVSTTPVGFKHIVAEMLAGGVLIGGEESGGIAVAEFLPERDGILCGLILRELVLRSGKSLRANLDALYDQYGRSVYRRWDLHIPADRKDAILEALAERPPEAVGDQRVESIERTDGFKFWLPGGGWLLTRASGTEPILRVYVEAADDATVEAIYRDFSAWTERA